MKRLFPLLMLLCTLLVSLSVAHAKDDGHDKDRAFIRKAYADTDKAASNGDVEGYVKYTADDCVNIDEDGQSTPYNKEASKARFMYVYKDGGRTNATTTIIDMTFDKQGATVTETGHTILIGKHGDKKQVIDVTSTCRDFWAKSHGGWLQKRSRTLVSHITVNGKPVK